MENKNKNLNKMKNLIYFIAGVLFITLISATTVSVMTIKPATPKSTIVFYKNWGDEQETITKIQQYTKAGYVYKGSIETDTRAIIIMEKY
jgi:hypothetical protein